jgi:ubiquinone/menaquinone biosynthesis C-methylase UbiE
MGRQLSSKSLDWNGLWKQDRGGDSTRDRRDYWDRRAPSFANSSVEDGYSEPFLSILNAEADWTVLDVGCGPGTLAMPLAKSVRSITAIDFAPSMIDLLNSRCRSAGIKNITTHVTGWEDDWSSLGIGPHDAAIASRSLVVDDLQAALEKLTNFAKKRVVISAPAGEGPFDAQLFAVVGRELKAKPDYIYIYNLLYQMDIYANVFFVVKKFCRTFASAEEAYNSVSWMFEELSSVEESRLQSFLSTHLVRDGERWKLDYERRVHWAVIWWDKA